MKRKFNFFSYALTYVLSLIVMGFINLAFAKFDISTIQTAGYWWNTLSTSTLYIVLYVNSVRLKVDLDLETNKVYNDNEDSIIKHLDKFLTERFDTFVVDYNFKNKKREWIRVQRAKRGKLLDKQKFKIASQINTLPKEEWGYRTRRFARKLDKIDFKLNEEWIDKNLYYVRFKYPKITRQEIITGFDNPSRKRSVLDKTFMLRSIMQKSWLMIISVVVTAIIQALIFEDSPFNKDAIIKMGITLLMGTLNVITGLSTGRKIFRSSIVNNQNIRLTIIDSYLRILKSTEV